ncbi:MAG: hypothetical protein KC561_01620, partial [Myxococcales bacterium]|nr:hypothetical protein [Myxococcales bacterium]
PSDGGFSVLLTESDLGGDFGALSLGSPTFVVWYDDEFESHLSAVELGASPTAFEVTEGLGFVSDLARTADLLFVPDRSRANPGVRVFATETLEELPDSPISTGLPPWSLELVSR